jgi:hypothetical protein
MSFSFNARVDVKSDDTVDITVNAGTTGVFRLTVEAETMAGIAAPVFLYDDEAVSCQAQFGTLSPEAVMNLADALRGLAILARGGRAASMSSAERHEADRALHRVPLHLTPRIVRAPDVPDEAPGSPDDDPFPSTF